MQLTRADLFSLEAYAEVRPEFRARVMAHKRHRQVALGPHATLYFEDRLTVQYQVQEMLRMERRFEPAAIQDELDSFNPLIPDGSNWKATLMIEYLDPHEYREALVRLRGFAGMVWVQVEGCERVHAAADEDLSRGAATLPSAVHFLRFELTPAMVGAVTSGARLRIGCDHPAYRHEVEAPPRVRDSLAADLEAY